MQQLPRLNKKFLTVSGLNDIEEEKRYWQSAGVEERLGAIELNRRMVYGKDRVSSRLQRLLRLLNSHEVEYLIVGGYAVGLYGYPRLPPVVKGNKR